jgi:hypothetical protein
MLAVDSSAAYRFTARAVASIHCKVIVLVAVTDLLPAALRLRVSGALVL